MIKYKVCLTRESTRYARVLPDGRLRCALRFPRTTCGALCIGNCHAHRLTLPAERALFREYESGVEFVRSLFEKSMTHGYP
jgi:hypothetical protein